MPALRRPASLAPVVLITGAASGIGLATARRFAKAGWVVVGTYRRQTRLTAHLAIDLQPAEMSRPADLERVIEYVGRHYGRLDALVCNAGYGLTGPIESLGYAQMKDLLAVNTLAPAELTRRALPLLKQRKGAVVLVSSIAGRVGVPLYSAYAASKWGLEGFGESLAAEIAPTGVRVRLVEPSSTDTPFWRGLSRGGASVWRNEDFGRVGAEAGRAHHGLTADEVAETILRAVESPSSRLRYPLGQTRYAEWARRLLPERLLVRVLAKVAE